MREKVLTVTIKDCKVGTFRAGGPGGQNQNKRDTGVRVVHPPSGAVGVSREERSQLLNKRKAFVRMAQSVSFQRWVQEMHLKLPPIDDVVEAQMAPENLLIEIKEAGSWVAA